MMTFIWPIMLWLLIILPLFVLVYMGLQQRRRRMVAKYGSLGLVQAPGGRAVGYRRHVPPLMFLTGLGILIVSLARPQAVVSLPRIQGTVILVFDVSGSMAANDVDAHAHRGRQGHRAEVRGQPAGRRSGRGGGVQRQWSISAGAHR